MDFRIERVVGAETAALESPNRTLIGSDEVKIVPKDATKLKTFDGKTLSLNHIEILKQLSTDHAFCQINRSRVKGMCVNCIKKNYKVGEKPALIKIKTYCPVCPGGNWICEPCFDATHNLMTK